MVVDFIYQGLADVSAVLNHLQIQWCITCGTLLGGFRDDGLLRYDTDADLSVFTRDRDDFMAEVVPELAHFLTLKGYRVYRSGEFFIKVLPPVSAQLNAKQIHKECVSRVGEASIQHKLKWGRGVVQRQAKMFEKAYATRPDKPDFQVIGPTVIDIAVDRLTKNTAFVRDGGLLTPPRFARDI